MHSMNEFYLEFVWNFLWLLLRGVVDVVGVVGVVGGGVVVLLRLRGADEVNCPTEGEADEWP